MIDPREVWRRLETPAGRAALAALLRWAMEVDDAARTAEGVAAATGKSEARR